MLPRTTCEHGACLPLSTPRFTRAVLRFDGMLVVPSSPGLDDAICRRGQQQRLAGLDTKQAGDSQLVAQRSSALSPPNTRKVLVLALVANGGCATGAARQAAALLDHGDALDVAAGVGVLQGRPRGTSWTTTWRCQWLGRAVASRCSPPWHRHRSCTLAAHLRHIHRRGRRSFRPKPLTTRGLASRVCGGHERWRSADHVALLGAP